MPHLQNLIDGLAGIILRGRTTSSLSLRVTVHFRNLDNQNRCGSKPEAEHAPGILLLFRLIYGLKEDMTESERREPVYSPSSLRIAFRFFHIGLEGLVEFL